MEEKEYTTDEIFALLPKLKQIFKNYQTRIRYPQARLGQTKEEVIQERDDILSVVQNLDLIDLKIIFFLHRTKRITASKCCQALQSLYKAQKEAETLLLPPLQ